MVLVLWNKTWQWHSFFFFFPYDLNKKNINKCRIINDIVYAGGVREDKPVGGNMIKGNKQEIIFLGCYIAGESLSCRMILREGNVFMSSTTGGWIYWG